MSKTINTNAMKIFFPFLFMVHFAKGWSPQTRAKFLSSSATAFLLSSSFVTGNPEECEASVFDRMIPGRKVETPRYIDKELQMKYGDDKGKRVCWFLCECLTSKALLILGLCASPFIDFPTNLPQTRRKSTNSRYAGTTIYWRLHAISISSETRVARQGMAGTTTVPARRLFPIRYKRRWLVLHCTQIGISH